MFFQRVDGTPAGRLVTAAVIVLGVGALLALLLSVLIPIVAFVWFFGALIVDQVAEAKADEPVPFAGDDAVSEES